MRLQVLLSIIIFLAASPSGIAAPAGDEVNYKNQVVASIDSDQAVADASKFLIKKHATVLNYNYEAKWDTGSRSFVFQGDNTDEVGNIDWAETKIQVVGHGSVADTTVGGLSPQVLAEQINTMTNGKGAKKISIVSCTKGTETEMVGNTEPAYLSELMNEIKRLGMPVSEVSIRSSLVAVNGKGEKLTGRVQMEGETARRYHGIKWSSNDRGLKWIGSIEDGNVKVVPATEGSDNIETRFVGIVAKNVPIHMADKNDAQTSYRISDEEAFQMLDDVAKEVFSTGDREERAVTRDYDVALFEAEGQPFIRDRIAVRDIIPENFIDELRYQATHYDKNSQGHEYYRFGDLIVKVGLNDFYTQVVGILDDNPYVDELYDKFKKFPKDYEEMRPKTGPTFFEDVKSWINGHNSRIRMTPDNFEEHVYNAQTGVAMFFSESIRCFQNHYTNMMVLDMVDANLMTKELYFGRNINPMARGGTWIGHIATGIDLLDAYIKPGIPNRQNLKKARKAIVERLSRITKSWLSHVDKDNVNGLRNDPPQANARDLGSFRDMVTPLIKSIGNTVPGSEDHLRDYTQRLSDYLATNEFTEPEIGSMETQNNDLSTTEDNSASLRGSLAISADHAKVSKAISDSIQERETQLNKKFEMVSDSISVSEGKYIRFTVYDKENPTHTQELLATVDESELSSREMLNDIQQEANNYAVEATRRPASEIIGKAMAIVGVVTGFTGALGKLEEGQYVEGSIYLAQSLHGLSDLAGINQKIWQASKNFINRALQGPMNELSASTAVADAERAVGSEISSVIGKVNLNFLDNIPIIGTAFAIYSIYEDMARHSVIGYIDAGLDILTAGLSFFGPEAEPFVIALSIIRMGIDTFYNDIGKQLSDLPSDASFSDKVEAVFRGIGDSVVDLAKEYTLIGQIYSAIENTKALDEKYKEQQQFLQSLTDFSNYYSIASGSGSSQINFGEGTASLYGGGIRFVLGESRTSQLTIEIFDSDRQDRSVTRTIDTQGVEDITMGIGETYSFQFKKEQVKIFMCIPVDTKRVISGNTTDRHSLHGDYTGNSKGNSFYAIQEIPSNLNLNYELSEYFYQLFGGEGNDVFYLGPQITYVEGNEGSDTYYVSSKSTITTIFNYASDNKEDFLMLYLNLNEIEATRQDQDAILKSSDHTDQHLVKLNYWFVGELYQHLTIKTEDGFACTISATDRDTHLDLTPYAFDGKSYKSSVSFDAENPMRPHVKVITGSSHNDHLYGNDLDNQINGNGGSDTLMGRNGRDLYILRENRNSNSVIKNEAEDSHMDILSLCGREKDDIHLSASGQDLKIRTYSCNSEVRIEKWFSDAKYRHLLLSTEDGEILEVSSTVDNLNLKLVMVDLSLQNQRNIELDVFLFGETMGSRVTGSYNYQVRNGIDLSRDEEFSQAVTIIGSDQPDWIVGNTQNNYISAGKGEDFLYGKEGYDVYVIKQGDGLNHIFQLFDGDTNMDTILFDADYEDIYLIKEDLYYGLEAYKHTSNYMAVALSCLFYEDRQSLSSYQLTASLQSCMELNDLYRVKSRDGIVFKIPNSANVAQVKMPEMIDYSHTSKMLTAQFTQESTKAKRFIGSTNYDVIVGNSLTNYIDPGKGGCYMEGKDGSDTYVIKSDYGTDNGIYNLASDYAMDTLLFSVPFDSISVQVSDTEVILTSSTDGNSNVGVTLYLYASSDAERHLVVVTGDGITFALPPDKNYAPTPLIINKSQMKTGQFISLGGNSQYSEVKTVYGSNEFENHLVGNDLKNTVVGGSKDDLLQGLDGDDVIKGGAGRDILQGGSGADNLVGGPDDDTLYGQDGNDVIAPGLGSNVVYGGEGVDTVVYGESGGIEAILSDNVIYHPHDTVVDRVYEVENVFGTIENDILQGDDSDNVLMGLSGNDELYTGKRGSDLLKGGEGSDTYSWLRASQAFTSDIDATMIVDNYATDGQLDTVVHDLTVQRRSQLGFEKSNTDLVIRKINQQYPVFYEKGPIVVLKNWFHEEQPERYRHIQLRLSEEVISNSQLESIGNEAAQRERQNMLTLG